MAELLIANGAAASDLEKGRLLREAVYANNTVLAERLLAYGADVNLPDTDGNPPLHLAGGRRDLAMLRLLVAHGADVNLRNSAGDFQENIPLRWRFDFNFLVNIDHINPYIEIVWWIVIKFPRIKIPFGDVLTLCG